MVVYHKQSISNDEIILHKVHQVNPNIKKTNKEFLFFMKHNLKGSVEVQGQTPINRDRR